MSPAVRRLARVLLSLVVLAACGWYFATKVDLRAAWHHLSEARFWLVALAAVVNMVLHLPAKSVRWQLMLAPMRVLPQHRVYNFLVAGYAASNLLPARMGEAVRVLFCKRQGVPVGGATGALVLEKVYELIGMLAIILPLPFVLPELPGYAQKAIPLVAVGGLVGTGVMFWMARHGAKTTGSFLQRLGEGMLLLREPRRATVALLLSIATWAVDAYQVTLIMSAVGIPPSFWGAAFMLLVLNIGIALPSTPAQLGIFEAACVGGFALLGVPQEKALAFAILYHVMQIIPVTIYGGIMLARYGIPRETPTAEAPTGA